MDFFLIGKSNNGWMDELLFEDFKEPGEEESKLKSTAPSGSAERVLQESLGSFKIKRESGFNFGAFLDELKYWIYILSWLNKIIAGYFVTKSKEWDEISVGFFNYVTISQKIHFVLFNLVSVDVVFLGTRTILHTKLVRQIGFYWCWTILVYNLVILDIVEMAYLSMTLVYSTFKQLKVESGQKLALDEENKKQEQKIDLGKSQNDSLHGLRKHEVSKRSFALKNFGVTGMRNWFKDEDVCEAGGVMTPQDAEKLGFVRVIDHYRSKNILSLNLAVISHATAELKPSQKVFDFKTVLMANFAFVIRVVLYHIFIVALSNQPGILIFFLIALEGSYIALIIKNFIILKYLISTHLFIAKVIQSSFLLFFHLISMVMFFQNGPTSLIQPSMSLQNVSMWCLIVSIGLEYIFLVVNIIWIVRTLLQARKQTQEQLKVRKLNKKSNPFLVYKWVRKRAYDQDKGILNRDPFASVTTLDKPLEENKLGGKKSKKTKDKLKDSVQMAKSVNKVRGKSEQEEKVEIS